MLRHRIISIVHTLLDIPFGMTLPTGHTPCCPQAVPENSACNLHPTAYCLPQLGTLFSLGTMGKQ